MTRPLADCKIFQMEIASRWKIFYRSPVATLQRSTLAEQAYRTLRDRILQGELTAGQRLLPEQLGEALAISPTPIKEALAMLLRDGLIEVKSRRFSVVRRFTPHDIRELYDARLMIESRAIDVGLAAGRVDKTFLARFEECVALCAERSRHRRTADLRQALRHDHDLHTRLVELAGNGLMTEWHQRLLRQTQLVRAYSLRAYDAGELAQAQREHAAILAALRTGRPATALKALQAHLSTSCENVLAAHA